MIEINRDIRLNWAELLRIVNLALNDLWDSTHRLLILPSRVLLLRWSARNLLSGHEGLAVFLNLLFVNDQSTLDLYRGILLLTLRNILLLSLAFKRRAGDLRPRPQLRWDVPFKIVLLRVDILSSSFHRFAECHGVVAIVAVVEWCWDVISLLLL